MRFEALAPAVARTPSGASLGLPAWGLGRSRPGRPPGYYAGPLDPAAGAFGAQVRVASSADTDSERVVEWSSERPRVGVASESTTGPDPRCHPTATPAFADGRVTIHLPVGRGCLSRRDLPDRLQVRLVTSWADGGVLDSLFTDQQYANGDAWVVLADDD